MNARELNGMLRFSNQRPMLILRDHEGGRIKVLEKRGGEEFVWAWTVIPGHLLGIREEVELLEYEGAERQERCSWGEVAFLLSELQQTGDYPCDETIDEIDPLDLLDWRA